MNNIKAVILAAGKGTRMKSDMPKVLHELCGKPLLYYVLKSVEELEIPDPYVIVGYQAEKVIDKFKDGKLKFVIQKEQLGTGHAVMQVEPLLSDGESTILVLNGDAPLISADILRPLIEYHFSKRAKATVLTAVVFQASGYGRVVRNPMGDLKKIVEEKDANTLELGINEINTGTYCFESKDLFSCLREVKPKNSQSEYYLTDVIGILKNKGKHVSALCMENASYAVGINTKEHLKEAENILNNKI